MKHECETLNLKVLVLGSIFFIDGFLLLCLLKRHRYRSINRSTSQIRGEEARHSRDFENIVTDGVAKVDGDGIWLELFIGW